MAPARRICLKAGSRPPAGPRLRSSRFWLVALLLAAVLACGRAWAAGQCRPPESLTSFGTWFTPNLELTAAEPDRPVDAARWVPDAQTMRLLLQISGGVDRQWRLVIRDQLYHVLATFYPEDFTAADGTGSKSRWTGRLPVASAVIDLRVDAASDAKVAVIGGIALPAVPTGERQYSTQKAEPAWRDLFDNKDPAPVATRRAGDAVGMLLGGNFDAGTGQQATWCCSGVMVSKTLMLTNWHCGGTSSTRTESYWNKDICANTLFDLGWDSGSVPQQYACSEVVAKDRSLDFALIRVRPVVGAGGGPPHASYARIALGPLPDAIFLIHHALCQPKLLSDRCHIRAQTYPNWADPAVATDFTHDCDSEPGASGAPVFDSGGRLVGLHHLGFACTPPDKANKAVPMSRIMEFLTLHAPDAASELQHP